MNYVRNAWYVASWSHDLQMSKPTAMKILGEPIVLFRGEAGQVFALEDRCVHRLAPLSLGRCEGNNLRCMYHGLLYSSDGVVIEIPGQDKIPDQAKVRAYPVIERHSWVWVWMGESDKADEDLIPGAVGLDDPEYILGYGQLDYNAEARLINDNLLDFSHLSFVHANSFESGPEYANTPAMIKPTERGISYERWVENTTGPAARRSSEPMDNYMLYEFLVPGVLLMETGVYPIGTAKACGYGAPDRSLGMQRSFTSQAVTPMSERTSRYFYSWGPHVSDGSIEKRDQMMELAGRAFAEDKVMIEAQQVCIDITPGSSVMPTAHDRGLTIFNRLVQRLSKN